MPDPDKQGSFFFHRPAYVLNILSVSNNSVFPIHLFFSNAVEQIQNRTKVKDHSDLIPAQKCHTVSFKSGYRPSVTRSSPLKVPNGREWTIPKYTTDRKLSLH